MAGKVQQSGLMVKLGNRLATAHAKHKDAETTYSGAGELPAGIENGIAQLVECKFGIYDKGDNKGEFYFYAAGIVIQPVTMPDGMKVQGLRTSITEPLCDTPKRTRQTVDDHLGWIYNELRKLGASTADIDPSQLEDVAAALKEAAPTFSFRTWKGAKATEGQYKDQEPRVQHQWNGIREVVVQDGAESGVQDNTDSSPEPESKPVQEKKAGPLATGKTTTKPAPKPEPAPEPDFSEFANDLDSLLVMAGDTDHPQNDAATTRLMELAMEAGMSEEDVNAAPSWESVVEAIKEAQDNADGGEEGEDGEPGEGDESDQWVPKVEDVYKYQPMDPKTKKPQVHPKTKKPVFVEGEVVKIDEAKRTVNLKSLDNPKTIYKDVSWDALQQDS